MDEPMQTTLPEAVLPFSRVSLSLSLLLLLVLRDCFVFQRVTSPRYRAKTDVLSRMIFVRHI